MNFIFAINSTNSNVNGYEIDNLPIEIPNEQKQKIYSNLVDQILTAKKAKPQIDTTALEAEIDKLVYKLYGLTEEEIQIVEESVG